MLQVEQIKFCGACVHTWPAKFQASKDWSVTGIELCGDE